MKNLLMIGMNFHTYEDNIKDCLNKLGFNVLKKTDMGKIFHGYSLLPQFVQKKHHKQHQRKILCELSESNINIDIVLVFVGRYLQRFFLEELKKQYPSAKFVLYLWDDVGRVENVNEVIDLYDDVITFELNDALKYGYRFIPLFYTQEYNNIKRNKIYDVCTISSVHSDRLSIVRKLLMNNNQGIKYQIYFRSDFSNYVKYLLSSKKKEDIKNGLIYTTKSLSITETSKMMSESRAILDIQHYTQKGLTIRTLEALGAGIKLITTNTEVQFYDFYNPNNIYILDRQNPYIDINFLKTPYEEVPKEIYEKYSLEEWLKAILLKTNNYYLKYAWKDMQTLMR